MRANDILTGLVLIAVASLMIVLTLGFPPFPGQRYGPSLFPRILGAGLLLCGVLLVARGIAERRAGPPWIVFAPWTTDPARLVSFLLVIGLTLLYILVAETIGFLPVAFLILCGLFLWFKVRPVVAVPVALIAVWVIHWFFATVMRVPLPRGILTNIL
jgi:putative tricarboxylic transport membrane protein